MRKLTILLTALIFSLTMMFSFPSYAKWTKVGDSGYGTNYVDFERIRKRGGYVYYWDLTDLLKPGKWGVLSEKIYSQGDCKLFRFKYLSFLFYKEPMGGETGFTVNKPDKVWNYPSPDTVGEIILKRVCKYAN